MAQIYKTVSDDAVDLICYRHYGEQAGVVEQVLEANPQLRGNVYRLPAGVDLVLPDVTANASKGAVKLWD